MANVNPTSVFNWPEFDPAANYELALVPAGADLNTAPPGTELNIFEAGPAEQAAALDLISGGTAAGSYGVQLRAEVGGAFTVWSSPLSIVWDNVYPGTPGPITVT